VKISNEGQTLKRNHDDRSFQCRLLKNVLISDFNKYFKETLQFMFVPRARHAHRSDLADIYFVRQSRTRSSSQEKNDGRKPKKSGMK